MGSLFRDTLKLYCMDSAFLHKAKGKINLQKFSNHDFPTDS